MKTKNIYRTGLCLALLLGSVTSLSGCNQVQPYTKGPNTIDKLEAEDANVSVKTVRIHFKNSTHEVSESALWVWKDGGEGKEFTFGSNDDYGAYCDLDYATSSIAGAKKVGVIMKSKGSWEWQSKDLFFEIPDAHTKEVFDIYLVEGIDSIYYSVEQTLQLQISSAKFRDANTLDISLLDTNNLFKNDAKDVVVYKNGNENDTVDCKKTFSKSGITCEFAENEIDIKTKYFVKILYGENKSAIKQCDVTFFYDTDEFKKEFTYFGDDLGVSFNNNHTGTTFKVWAPLSDKVTLNLYNTGTPKSIDSVNGRDNPIQTINMTKEQQGVWAVSFTNNLHGMYYTYTVKNGEEENEVVDPYAKSCGINGLRGLVVDFNKINEEVNWSEAKRPNDLNNEADQVIYEGHVHDLTIDKTSGVKDASFNGKNYKADKIRGTFLGLSQEGTRYKKTATGLDHLKDLGINTIQLQPFYDYSSVDESTEGGYNWGYDPLNYNCLEGSYSLEPHNGLERVKEFKTMMKSMCKNNIHVNMDVVYNHTSSTDNTNFEMILPGYYHRRAADGSYSNGSGCGNEMAAERPMVRKFIVDSCKFWFTEYNLSGFRFDLMKLIDVETMKEVASVCKEIYPAAAVYGEPWTGGSSTTTYKGVSQDNLDKVTGVGAFNDQIRNAIRGENTANANGWLQGNASSVNGVKNGILGTFKGGNMDPTKVVNYVSCHDNYTLFDQINLSKDNSELKRKATQANAIVMFAEGVPFMQEGDDFLRTKDDGKYKNINPDLIHNSYNYENNNIMHYDLKVKNKDVFDINKEMIALRQKYEGFRLSTSNDVKNSVNVISADANLIAYTITYKGTTIYVAHASSESNVDLGDSYKIEFSNNKSTKKGKTVNSYTLAKNESVVFVKK